MPDLTSPDLTHTDSTSPQPGHPGVAALARPSGGFAMLALDQRESLRAMFAEHTDRPVPDEVLTRFKVEACRALSPHASAVLVDRQFALDAVVAEGAVAPGCGLIAAADRFTAGPGEIVAESGIDPAVVPADMRAAGVIALKLLLIWRPDEDPDERLTTAAAFTSMCREAGLVSILEPVSRAPRDGREWDWDAGVLAAAAELGSCGADLYKAEVPRHGRGSDAEIQRRCERLTESFGAPWVVLSSGVRPDEFPHAVALACRSGASGFLAGRAVWREVAGRPGLEQALRTVSVPALRRLADAVDGNVRR